MKLVFAAFLCVCAWEDFREKKISVLFLWAAASVAAAWTAGYYIILLDWADMQRHIYGWLCVELPSSREFYCLYCRKLRKAQ